jgi:hypothetical protein
MTKTFIDHTNRLAETIAEAKGLLVLQIDNDPFIVDIWGNVKSCYESICASLALSCDWDEIERLTFLKIDCFKLLEILESILGSND